MIEWIVTSQESGHKLLSFLAQRLEGRYTARFLKRIIENNGCQVNGRMERFASTVLGQGDHICLFLQEASFSSPLSFESCRILYEDEALLVYDKPAGINSDAQGILRLLKAYNSSLLLVHRLDRETTGILLFAKTKTIFESLVNQFKQFKIQKRYRVIVDGILEKPHGIVENYLAKKQAYAGQSLWGVVKASQGLYACTEWERLKTGKNATLVNCFPKTGRTHQIRVHMAEMGHPIIGDFQYGKHFRCTYRPSRYLLHAEEIQFCHPLTEQLVCLPAPLPDDFKNAEQQLFKVG